MNTQRSSGVLLHVSSLPGPYGIGDFGPEAFRFVDSLANAGQGLWQVLPLGPTGYGDSPYQSFSTFAGNELFISPNLLSAQGWLSDSDIGPVPDFPDTKVDYGWVQWWKIPLLHKAAENFLASAPTAWKTRYAEFCRDEAFWLDDYALFMSVKDHYSKIAQEEGTFGAMWANHWPRPLALRNAEALTDWKRERHSDIEARKVIQFFFDDQVSSLKAYAASSGIAIVGDIPIFVAYDSVDVWAHPELFQLDTEGRPTAVAGVPPDYFSADGQLWGNPLYRWEAHQATDFSWWKNRLRRALRCCDMVRIDHFRGFEAYWSIDPSHKTARQGTWKKAPGEALFAALRSEFGGHLPVIAEDLGLITEEVHALRDRFGLPGMKVLQFAFSVDAESGELDAENPFLPHNIDENYVAYVGTHDNNTLLGWLEKEVPPELMAHIDRYLGLADCHIEDKPEVMDTLRSDELRARALMREALKSRARLCLLTAQDLLGLDSGARMNAPSTQGGHNWTWRMAEAELPPFTALWLRQACRAYHRVPFAHVDTSAAKTAKESKARAGQSHGKRPRGPVSDPGETIDASLFINLDAAFTACDSEGVIVYMNERSIKSFAKDGGAALIGKNLYACHQPGSNVMIRKMLETGENNVYTVKKGSTRKLIVQAPWFERNDDGSRGAVGGLIELNVPLKRKIPEIDRGE